ncbi:tetratricopeptide repeat protein [Paludisphaera sp.]|uniref:tetratricopeptide repeat protein n=1 Tax=Paludisphaera sp. TaxID=2017432 RepID=UPI00301D4358
MKTDRWMQTRWNRLRASHRADLPALTVARAVELTDRDPECGPAWRLMGSALVAMGRYTEASAAIHRAMALCPARLLWIPMSEMGHLYRASGSHDAAACWYRRAIEAAPEQAGARIYLGGVLALGGKLQEAEGVLRAATRCAEGCRDEAYLNLGLVLRSLDRLDEAAECLATALELDPGYKAAKHALRDVRQALRGRRVPIKRVAPRSEAAA